MTVVAENKVQIIDLHFELNLWLNELKFYKDEIQIFNNRLEEIVSKNNTVEIMSEVEHFQNQYIRQSEVLDELRHEIKQHENIIEKEATDNSVPFDHHYVEDHAELRSQIEQFKKIYADLKRDFMNFLIRRM